MAKSKQSNAGPAQPNPNVPNRDLLHRINHLTQVAAYLAQVAAPTPSTSNSSVVTTGPAQEKPRQRSIKADKSVRAKVAHNLSRELVSSAKAISRKSVLRLDPSVKHELCKICNARLIPGVNLSVRIKKSGPHGHVIRQTCMTCSSSRRLPAPQILPDKDEQLAIAKAEKWPKRQRKRLRQAVKADVFHRQSKHVIFRGTQKVESNTMEGIKVVGDVEMS